jgi:hypothetical protein
MGLATVLLKGRVRAAGLRRRRHDWQTEEAKVRGLRKDAMVCVCVCSRGGWWCTAICDMRRCSMSSSTLEAVSRLWEIRLRACGDYVRQGICKRDIEQHRMCNTDGDIDTNKFIRSIMTSNLH